MNHRASSPTLPFLLVLAACPAWTELPTDTAGALTTGGTTGDGTTAPTTTEPLPWPEPPQWQLPKLDLAAPDATTGGADTGGSVLTDSLDGPTIDLTALRVSEVLADPEGKDGAPGSLEFVEIVHVGDLPTPLAGLVVLARGWPELRSGDLGLADEVLAPGERLVILRHATAADLPVPPVIREGAVVRARFADSGGLRNDDGAVVLADERGWLADAVLYGAPQPPPFDGAPWLGAPAAAAASGSSLCRPDVTIDSDTAADWALCEPTPGELPPPADDTTGEPPLPAEVVAVEVLANPPGPATLEKHAEFIELINLGPGTVDLAGWTVADSTDPNAPGIDPLIYFGGDGGCAPQTCLAPGRRALLVGSLYEGPVGEALVLKTDDTALANAGLASTEPVVVRDAEGQVRTTYRVWDDSLAAPDPTANETAVVRGDPGAPDAPASWDFAAPTPGL